MKMPLPDVTLLAAPSARSQAYIQALAAAGLGPEAVILLAGPPPQLPSFLQATPTERWGDILIPDLSEPVEATCIRYGIPCHLCPEAGVDGPELAILLRRLAPQVVIYSGPGGKIVPPSTLALAPVFLHMHAGWLPKQRGSTTIYYTLLEGHTPAVSAIRLDPGIDTGPIISRRWFPLPSPELDLDYQVDPAIRADLLVDIMRHRATHGDLPPPIEQGEEDAALYYVIHPVLKHLARLSLAHNRGTDFDNCYLETRQPHRQ